MVGRFQKNSGVCDLGGMNPVMGMMGGSNPMMGMLPLPCLMKLSILPRSNSRISCARKAKTCSFSRGQTVHDRMLHK